MTSGNETFYDLQLLADRLPPRYQKVSKALRKYLQGHSASSDMEIARDCIRDACAIHAELSADVYLARMALLHTAVMAYNRVFDGNSRHRSRFTVGEAFDTRQRSMHAKLRDLRHESLAHFGHAGTHLPWSQDWALAIQSGNQMQTVVIARRSVFDQEFAIRFSQHLERTTDLVTAIVQQRRTKFEEILFENLEDEPDFVMIFETCAIDLQSLGDMAGAVLQGARSGRILTYDESTRIAPESPTY